MVLLACVVGAKTGPGAHTLDRALADSEAESWQFRCDGFYLQICNKEISRNKHEETLGDCAFPHQNRTHVHIQVDSEIPCALPM